LLVEALEGRVVPSAAGPVAHPADVFLPTAAGPLGYTSPVGLTPFEIRQAYGFHAIRFGTTVGNGAGQTIALIDAYDDPTIGADLAQFDWTFGLAAPPSFHRVAQDGSRNFPRTDPSGGWEMEEALDVEWAHALAPGASLLLVEADSNSFADLNAAVDYARHLQGMSVVLMSYGAREFGGETGFDGHFTTPTGHAGVTFVASSGDAGAPALYPAVSRNVLAVGGTTLRIDSEGHYLGETGWSGSGGGLSRYESQPSYQHGVVTQSGTQRGSPDVAFDADPNSGVAVCDSFDDPGGPWLQVGGTSFSAPAWAALIAVSDQGRVLNGLGTLDGASGTLPALYQLPGSDFHDIIHGNNGYRAGPGYDLVTGRGTPIANLIAADLAAPQGHVTQLRVTLPSQVAPSGSLLGVTVTAPDSHGNPVAGDSGTAHSAMLPAASAHPAADGGVSVLSATLRAPGFLSHTAGDATSADGTGAVQAMSGNGPTLTKPQGPEGFGGLPLASRRAELDALFSV
jgi:subtilase family serine protease